MADTLRSRLDSGVKSVLGTGKLLDAFYTGVLAAGIQLAIALLAVVAALFTATLGFLTGGSFWIFGSLFVALLVFASILAVPMAMALYEDMTQKDYTPLEFLLAFILTPIFSSIIAPLFGAVGVGVGMVVSVTAAVRVADWVEG